MVWLTLDALGGAVGRLVRWLGATTLGRALLVALAAAAAALALFHAGQAEGRVAEREKQAKRAARTAAAKRRAEDEVRDLGDDALVARARRWVRD